MNNYNEVLNAQAMQLKSAGLATERYAIYLDSIEGKANTLQASMETLWQKALNDDVIKFFLDLGISSTEAIDSMGGLIPILESIIALIGVLLAQKIVNFFLTASTAVNTFSVSIAGLKAALTALITPAGLLQIAIVALTAVVITYQNTVKKQTDIGLENTTNAWTEAFKNLDEELRTSIDLLNMYESIVSRISERQGFGDMFVDKQKIIDQGLKELISTLKDTSSNYDDYMEAVKKAAKIAGYTITENGDLIRSTTGVGRVVLKTADEFYILTDAELALFNATKAEIDGWADRWKRATSYVSDATGYLSDEFDRLKEILDDSFGKAFDSYHEKQEKAGIQAAELREEIRLLSEQPTLSDEQLTQLGDLQYELYNVEQDILKTADAYEKSLQASIISTFIQRISLSELSVDAKNTAYNMAADMMQAWGLMGAETVRVLGAMDQAMVDLSNGSYESAQIAISNILNIGNAASAISGNYYLNFVVTTTGNVVSPGTSGVPLMDGMLSPEDVKGMPFNPPPTNIPTRPSFPGFSGYGGSSGGGGGGGSSGSSKESIKTLKDLHNLVISLIKAEQNARKDALKDQIDGLEAQLDAYEEIIDAKKEILKAEQESIEYQEELEGKTKTIAQIQSEMAILALDTSAESKARQLELAEELADAQKDLEKAQRDRSYDLQEQALDQEYDLYKENIDSQIAIIEDAISAIDEYLDKTGQIAQDALDRIGEQAPDLYQSLIDWNKEYGSGIVTDVVEAWNEAYDALLKYGNLADALYGGVAPTQSTGTLPTHHSGLSSGAVGGVRTLPGEILSKLLVGEEVMNDNDILRTLKMIPSVANIISKNQGSGGLNIESLITIQGDVIEKTIPKIKDIARDVIKEINSTLIRQGSVRDVASIYG